MTAERAVADADLISPHGGGLVSRVLSGEAREEALPHEFTRPEVAAVLEEWVRGAEAPRPGQDADARGQARQKERMRAKRR